MKKENKQFIFSPTDLSGFINCKHLYFKLFIEFIDKVY